MRSITNLTCGLLSISHLSVSFLLVSFLLVACESASDHSAEESARTPASLLDSGTSYGSDSSRAYYENPEARALHTRNEILGRDIWIKATGGNERFYGYVVSQRISDRAVNFWRVLSSKKRKSRFNDWGLMNDPDCCTPGETGCPKTSLAETFGMDYCPGDEALLASVGKSDYRDPACDLDSAIRGKNLGWQSACDLKFGTSAGAVGFRKFPNPKFDRVKWEKLNGADPANWDGFSNSLRDASIEPPFRIGISCASCHTSFDPVRPPQDVNHPHWSNLSSTVGNQYLYIAQIFASGFPKDALEFQAFAQSRAGTVDTSLFPNDQIHNPGTMNSIMNLSKRPTFRETVDTWRRAESCSSVTPATEACTCNENGSRCYAKSTRSDDVFHELKGGEDSSGVLNSIQRVYINIGTCSEECWMNHLTDLRVLDKNARNYGETPFNIGQCRRDCSPFRALEDRVEMERDFLLTAAPTDLQKAKGFTSPQQLVNYIEMDRHFGAGSVTRGQALFTQNCAECHSSLGQGAHDYLAVDGAGRRVDWLGTDRRIPLARVGTNSCRAKHSNHQPGNIWATYSSKEEAAEGPGFYRAPSLLSVWAFAPFLHNNSVGEENFDPSVEGRLKSYESAMASLLSPDSRGRKISRTTSEIHLPAGPITLVIPKGVSVSRIASFRHKDFLNDLTSGGSSKAKQIVAGEIFEQMRSALSGQGSREIVLNEKNLIALGEAYSNCTDQIEDEGHAFGATLSESAKRDLTAFMETL